ncbi:hypothetical protein PGB90_004387 [Kerria lacca]
MGKVVLNVFLLTIISWAIVAYDVSVHGGLESSITGRYLKEAGLLLYVKPYYNIVEEQTLSLYRWGKKNFSDKEYNVLKNETIEVLKDVGKHMSYFLVNSISIIKHYSHSLYNWIIEQIPPNFSDKIMTFLSDGFNYWVSCSKAFRKYVLECIQRTLKWLGENITKEKLTWENVEKSYFEFAHSIQVYYIKFSTWIGRKITCLMSA